MNRNKIYNVFVFALLFVFSHTGMNAQSTVGKDFWVTFLPNYDVTVDELSLIAAGTDCLIFTGELQHWLHSDLYPGSLSEC